jgi:hypothetical protein
MAHDQDSNAAFEISVYDRVREDLQREGSSSSCRWYTETRVLNQELGDTLELFEKALSDHTSSVFAVKIQGIGNVMLRPWMKRVGYRGSLARSRAIAACPGIAAIKPDSSSASLRSASRSHALSISGSESRLEINRPSK